MLTYVLRLVARWETRMLEQLLHWIQHELKRRHHHHKPPHHHKLHRVELRLRQVRPPC